MSRAWGKGSTTRWRRIRAAILQRDHHRCTITGPGCTGTADQVDHIILKAMGGTDEPTNLRAACATCNQNRPRPRPEPEPPHRRVSRW